MKLVVVSVVAIAVLFARPAGVQALINALGATELFDTRNQSM